MTRQEIEGVLRNCDNTVLSFPNRGPWGSSSYRGNCSGWIPAFFIWKYEAKKVAEIFAGSGTTYDVCKDMGVSYTGIDLNPNPTRDKIISMDVLDYSKELPDGFYDSDMVFLHPPYPSIHEVRYAGNMWKDNGNLKKKDIQEMSWEDGMNAVNKAIMRAYSAMQPGAFEVILVGEIRSKGQYRSMYQNLVLPGTLHQTFVKLQHNCVSNGRTYANKSKFALTGHEMIAVIKKESGYEIAYVIPKTYKMDIRDCKCATWKDVVLTAARDLQSFRLAEIYAAIDGHEKCKSNPNFWKDQVRAVLQKLEKSGLVKHVSTGMWAAA